MDDRRAQRFGSGLGVGRAALYLTIALALTGWLVPRARAQQRSGSRSETKPAAAADSSKTAASATPAVESDSSGSSDQAASDAPAAPAGIHVGNYNIQGTLDLGWRYSSITGSQANYDTFVNLQQGARLLDFSVNAYSLNHAGAVFDTLSLSGSGFGGDPTDVVRLGLTKDKWYDFNATYRRYKYFWGYDLLANPLNASNTAQPITAAPHLMDLSHRMSDFQLTLLPQSKIRFRLGYAHNLEVGPSFTTEGAAVAPISEPGATALLFQNFKSTDDLYHVGVDFTLLPQTTLSYDEFIQRYKEDAQAADNNLLYKLPNGVPVDLGLVFSAAAGTACNPSSPATPVAVNCQANLFYDRGGRPRGSTPTEHFSFQSTYFPKLTLAGAVAYSSGDQTVDDLFDTWGGLNTRINSTGTDTTATSKATRVIVNADANAVYQITGKLRAMDSFSYYVYRIPGIYNFGVANFFAQLGPGGHPSLELPPGQFNSTDCPPPFTAPTCPQHNSSSGPDLATGYRSIYLGQDFRSNTFELTYDFTPKVGARLGYRYTKRRITDFAALFYTGETFFPGGAGPDRGDCALVGGQLPVGCTPQPDGSVVFAGLVPGSDTSHNVMADINGNSALFGLWVKPATNFRTSFDMELFSADASFTRITPRLLRRYLLNSTYTPVPWAEVTGTVDIVDSSNDVAEVQNQDHNRSFGLATVFNPSGRFSFDLTYNYDDVYTQALVCYSVGFGPIPAGAAPCPIPQSPVPVAAITTYASKSNFAGADLTVTPSKQVSLTMGYAGSFVKGTPSWYNPLGTYSLNFLDPRTPWGPLRFNYQLPYVKLQWNVYKGLSYFAGWNYYGYNSRGDNNPVGLAPLGTQDFNGNNMTLSVRYAF